MATLDEILKRREQSYQDFQQAGKPLRPATGFNPISAMREDPEGAGLASGLPARPRFQREVPLFSPGQEAGGFQGPPAPPTAPVVTPDEGLPEGYRMPQAPQTPTFAPPEQAPPAPPETKTFVPSIRDQMNEGIARDWQQGIDRGLPWIGGGGGKWVTQIAKSEQPSAPMQIKTDDPRHLRIASFANQVGADPALALAIAERESGFNQGATGPVTRSGQRAMGDMQIMPGTFADMNRKYGAGKWDMGNRDHQTLAGVHYLADMVKIASGDPFKAALAYIGGPGNIATFASGKDVTDGAPGRVGTKSSAYAQSIADRYSQWLGKASAQDSPRSNADGMQITGSQEIPGTGPQDSGPLRQPVEIIRGLQRTAFDPLAQQEFVSAPPGTPPTLAMLASLASRGMLPQGVGAQVVNEEGGLQRALVQERGASGRQAVANQGAADVARIQADSQGGRLNSVLGDLLKQEIDEANARGATPEQRMAIVRKYSGGKDQEFLLVRGGQRTVTDSLGGVRPVQDPDRIYHTASNRWLDLPKETQKVDAAKERADAESARKRGAPLDQINKRLKDMGLEPLK